MARSRCSFSVLICYGSLKVRSVNALLYTGLIEAEESLFREWNHFEPLARSGKKTESLCRSGNGPAISLQIQIPDMDASLFRSGNGPACSLVVQTLWKWSRGRKHSILCLMIETYCTARKCRRKHSVLLLGLFGCSLGF
jgi:hypothetical protein